VVVEVLVEVLVVDVLVVEVVDVEDEVLVELVEVLVVVASGKGTVTRIMYILP